MAKAFEALIDAAIVGGASAVAVLTNVGGFSYLPRVGRQRVVRAAVSAAGGRVPVLAGVGDHSLASTATNIVEAQKAGASALLLSPVSHLRLETAEVDGLVKDLVATAETGIWLHNNPAAARYRFSVEDLARWAPLRGVKGFMDVAATSSEAKDRNKRLLAELSPRTGKLLNHGFGGDAIGAQLLLAGIPTWHSDLAGVLPDAAGAIAYAVENGLRPQARAIQRQLAPLALLAEQYGSMRVVHAIGSLQGKEMGQLPRPLLPVSREVRNLVRYSLADVVVPEDLLEATREAAAGRAAVELGRPHEVPGEAPTGQGRHRSAEKLPG